MVVVGSEGVTGVWMGENRLTSYKVSACSSNNEVSPWPSNFLEARVGGARRVRRAGERRVKSISNRVDFYARCHGKRKELESNPRCSLNLSE